MYNIILQQHQKYNNIVYVLYIEWASALVPPTLYLGGPVERGREREREKERKKERKKDTKKQRKKERKKERKKDR